MRRGAYSIVGDQIISAGDQRFVNYSSAITTVFHSISSALITSRGDQSRWHQCLVYGDVNEASSVEVGRACVGRR